MAPPCLAKLRRGWASEFSQLTVTGAGLPTKRQSFWISQTPSSAKLSRISSWQKKNGWLHALQHRCAAQQAKPERDRRRRGRPKASLSLCHRAVPSFLMESQTSPSKTAARSSLQTSCTTDCQTSCNMRAAWGSCVSWKIPSPAGIGALPFSWISWRTQGLDSTHHGGCRPKLTRFWSSKDVLSSLAATCDNMRPHKPWKPMLKGNRLHFVTKDEAQYPELLCVRLVSVLVQLHFPRLEHQTLHHQFRADPASATRLVLGKQPRGNKLKPLVSEFSSYIFSVSPVTSQSANALLAQQAKGARIVHRWLLKFSDRGSVQPNPPDFGVDFNYLDGLDSSSSPGAQVEVCQIGLPCSPEEFLNRAVLAAIRLLAMEHATRFRRR